MFYFSLDHPTIAYQIAGLVNTHNRLDSQRSGHDILHGPVNYVVETHGKWVIGVAGLHRQSYTFTEIKHLVVHPDWRGKGLSRFLLQRSLSIVDTKMMYATVRDDNAASLHLFESLGFKNSGGYEAEGHNVILLVKVNPQWQQAKSNLKSSWLDDKTSIAEMAASTLRSLRPISYQTEAPMGDEEYEE
jgi:N-acetylglutamate synthase-like GNAT family acetyltransferase